MLSIQDLQCLELFPDPDPSVQAGLREQRFRTDINYKMTIGLAAGFVPEKPDILGVSTRRPGLFSASSIVVAQEIVAALESAVDAVNRIRKDAAARRGKATLIALTNEYDLHNLAEMVLAPFLPLAREPFSIRCDGIERTPDFSIAQGRIVIEFKFAKDSSEWASNLKEAQGVLPCYLSHPGVETAIAILGVIDEVSIDRNAVESTADFRPGRQGLLRVLRIRVGLLSPFSK